MSGDLTEFQRWATGNLVENRNRGIYGEWLVGQALGVIGDDEVRQDWDAVDLRQRSSADTRKIRVATEPTKRDGLRGQLASISSTTIRPKSQVTCVSAGHQTNAMSGWGDLNSRPPAPKAGALPDCATSRIDKCRGTFPFWSQAMYPRVHKKCFKRLFSRDG